MAQLSNTSVSMHCISATGVMIFDMGGTLVDPMVNEKQIRHTGRTYVGKREGKRREREKEGRGRRKKKRQRPACLFRGASGKREQE